MEFLSAHCKSVIAEKVTKYNGRLSALKINYTMLGISNNINSKLLDIEELKKDADTSLKSEIEYFASDCVCPFIYCLIVIILAPVSTIYQPLYFFLFFFTLLLSIYSFLLRISLKNILLKSIIIHIAISIFLSCLFCVFTPRCIHLIFGKNVFILFSIFFSIWRFIRQSLLMLFFYPQIIFKRRCMESSTLNKDIKASRTLIKSPYSRVEVNL
jgi:hypothetical protein